MEPFQPPFCPNQACSFHCTSEGWKCKRAGFFSPDHCKPRSIQRYRCLHCGRSFSTQTFLTTYWLRRPDLQRTIFERSLGCSGLRQIAWDLGVSPSTVQAQLSRLGRHCLLFQQAHLPEVREPVVLDGFESFEYSQYFPFHFNILVGKDSHFLYGFTDSPLRRKGRMTRYQRRRREELERALGRPDPRAIENGVYELLKMYLPKSRKLVLYTDDHPDYPRALRRLPELEVRHDVTSSLERRTASNPLFPVNLMDLLFRHRGANHKRETIAYSKRRQGAIERLAIFQVSRNFLRPRFVKRRTPTPAVSLGVAKRRMTVGEVLGRRLFVSRVQLQERLAGYYRGVVRTTAYPVNREHWLRYAG